MAPDLRRRHRRAVGRRGLRMAGQSHADDRLWAWWQENDLDVESGLAHTEALVHGRSYITVSASPDENGSPIIRAESPKHMWVDIDRKSTRLNSSHVRISYAVFCLKKKNMMTTAS